MLTPRFIRTHLELVETSLKKRGAEASLGPFQSLEEERLTVLAKMEEMKARRNVVSREIGIGKQKGEDVSETMKEMKVLASSIKEKEAKLQVVEKKVLDLCHWLPNVLDDEVPEGKTADDNLEIKRWGEKPCFDFSPRDHLSLAIGCGIVDMERATKVTGARFSFLKDKGARLERALIDFFLEENRSRGYTEYSPPLLVNTASLFGTAQLPKFEEDVFRLKRPDYYYLIPTAEVPLTNYYREEILSQEELPIKMTAHSSCFRSEAGAAGQESRGLIRQHQFEKVELVKICHPRHSPNEHEAMLADAESLLQKLNLTYRVVSLCGGDIGFGARKCYDLEVWLPSQEKYVEISSVSNFGDFQANRAQIRIKEKESKNIPAHTLNASALAVGRTMVAILENYQQADGSVSMPEAIVDRLGFSKVGVSPP